MKIPLSDARISEAVALDEKGGMAHVDVDVQAEEPAPLEYRRAEDVAYFTMSEHKPGMNNEVSVRIEGGHLVFMPKRSAAHRDLLRKLGELP